MLSLYDYKRSLSLSLFSLLPFLMRGGFTALRSDKDPLKQQRQHGLLNLDAGVVLLYKKESKQ